MAAAISGRLLLLQAGKLLYDEADDLARDGASPSTTGGDQGRRGSLALGKQGNASGRGFDLFQQEAADELTT
jgi:hypothetical protein